MEPKVLIEKITKWIADYCKTNNRKSLVVGVSGGIDSSVVARLCEKTEIKTICIAMPFDIKEDKESLRLAKLLCKKRNVLFTIYPIGTIANSYFSTSSFVPMGFESTTDKDIYLGGHDKTRKGNIRSRIRANVLYDIAHREDGIVVGTGNKDEDEIGYFTKGGDGLTDINPLSSIHKSVVRKMGKLLKVPKEIIKSKPTAGLWEGQTDEDELGMTYDEVEWAIKWDDEKNNKSLIKNRPQNYQYVLKKVRHRRKIYKHKLSYPPVFSPLED